MIVAKNISVSKFGKTVMSIENFESFPESIIGIIGVSGSGKSTLLNCLGLLDLPESGTLIIDGKDHLSSKKSDRTAFWRNKASFVFQDYGIINDWTLGDNIVLQQSNLWRRSKSRFEVQKILAQVGLSGRGQEMASTLSGGEKQRLGIARALYKKSKYIFADEPTASLDSNNRQLVIELLRKAAHQGATVICATHDEDMISSCDYVYELYIPHAKG